VTELHHNLSSGLRETSLWAACDEFTARSPHLGYAQATVNRFVVCSSGRRLRISLPRLDDVELPIVESAAELRDMPDLPRIEFEIICDDGGDAWPTTMEQLEAVAFLAARWLVPKGLGDDLRRVIAELEEP
jgi:hypothetical protein